MRTFISKRKQDIIKFSQANVLSIHINDSNIIGSKFKFAQTISNLMPFIFLFCHVQMITIGKHRSKSLRLSWRTGGKILFYMDISVYTLLSPYQELFF